MKLLHIDSIAPPVAKQHSRVPCHRWAKVAKEIAKLEDADVIEKVRPDRVGIENCDDTQAKETGRDRALCAHEGTEQGHSPNEACDAPPRMSSSQRLMARPCSV